MIEYQRAEQIEMIQAKGFLVKVIGVGGAGSNVLDQIALDGMDDAELICMNTDVRTLKTSTAHAKVQIGKQLTRGLGAGGDPELGILASEEAEEEIRASVRGQDMVFICTGLGGGTGSGAAPTVSRIAKEEGAFVVVFATMPFSFEGRRRIQQAETALKLLERSADALITFENDRMGELVLPKEGIQQAFSNADKIISQSVRAITNVVTQPGLIQIGMDDLLTALKTPTSRCLFGYGEASGKNRAQEALKLALRSPLLDRGKLLGKSRNALVHIVGGPSMTLYEVELLMNQMSKNVGHETQILFGSATDEKMEDRLSITIISSLTLDDLRHHHSSLAQTETTESPAGYVTSKPGGDHDASRNGQGTAEEYADEAADGSEDEEEPIAEAEESQSVNETDAENERALEEAERRRLAAETRARQEAEARAEREAAEAKARARREREEADARQAQAQAEAEAEEQRKAEAAEAAAKAKAKAEADTARRQEHLAETGSSKANGDPRRAGNPIPPPRPPRDEMVPEEEADSETSQDESAEDAAERARREAFERRKAELRRTAATATQSSEPSSTPSAPASAPVRPTAEELMNQRRLAQEELKRKREELERLLKLEDEAKRRRSAPTATERPAEPPVAAATETDSDDDDEESSADEVPSSRRETQEPDNGLRRLRKPGLAGNQARARAPEDSDDAATSAAQRGGARPTAQAELQLEPLRGRFEKAVPTMVDGENLDVPTFFRKRGKKA